MNRNQEKTQKIFNSRESAALLNIKESTLRKYVLLLEDAGYKFHKNELGHRGYYENDIVSLKKLLEIKEFPEMTLKRSASAVMSWVQGDDLSEAEIYDNIFSYTRHNASYNELHKEIQDFKKRHEAYNHTLMERMEKQEKVLNEIHEKIGKLIKEQ
ncbi:DNA-binding protein [Aquibacillus halophilus]|uniref:DNA-binding protein n=1 Tax=Aquibacillus halophilus TaxID=930132 RepID=UPI00196A7579|nr:DNA-binding protein [Aquibacillus halophilus]